ncbi:MAG: hypothetical protein ACRENP_02315 [Longimicrobiales bacterium]
MRPQWKSQPIGRIVRAALYRLSALCGLGIALLAPLGSELHAQVILITEPVEWKDGKPLVIRTGQSIRIAGTVSHPAGVLRVLVNGQEAFLQADRDYPDLFRFEKVVVADNSTREVVISIVPRTSQPYRRTYGLEGTGPTIEASRVDSVRSPVQPGPQRNPWKGFTLRAIGYAALGAGGAALTIMKKDETSEVCTPTGGGVDCVMRTEQKTPYRTVGLGLAGAAVAGLIIDAVITSGKARSAAAAPPSENNTHQFSFQPFTLSNAQNGLRLEFFRISYFRR